MTKKPLSIVFFGNTNNYPLLLAEAFRDSGHDVRLIVNRKDLLHRPESKYPEWKNAYPSWIKDYAHLSDDDLFRKTPALQPLIQELSAPADLAVLNDVGPSLAGYLKIPHVSILTGSDLSFYADYASIEKRSKSWSPEYKRSMNGREALYRLAEFVAAQRDGIAASEIVCYGQKGLIPEGDRILETLGVTEEQRMMLYLSDTFRLEPSSPRGHERLRIFCGSRIVFKPSADPAFGTIDIKGSDLLIKGYAEYCRRGGQGELRLPRKGSDVEAAVQLIEDLGIEKRVLWLDEMPLSDFYREMGEADLVCDQMGTSFPGMVTMDAYAMGKPVMAHFRNDIMTKAFPEPLPGLNVTSSAEVAENLLKAEKNPASLIQLGRQSRRYAETYLSPSVMAQHLLVRCGLHAANGKESSSFNFQRTLQPSGRVSGRFLKLPLPSGDREELNEEDVQALWHNPKLLRLFIETLKFLEKIPGLSKARALMNEVRKRGALAALRGVKALFVRLVHRCRMRLAGLACMDVPFDSNWPSREQFLPPRSFSSAAFTGKPSICLVTVNLSSGGAERQVAGLAVELQKRGFSVRVRVLRLNGENGHYLDLLKRHKIDVEVPRFPGRADILSMKNQGVDLRLLRHLPEDLRSEALALTSDLLRSPVDIVHCYLDWSCCYAGFAALLSGTPLVRFSWRNVNPSHFEFYREWMPQLYGFYQKFPNFSFENNTEHGAADYARWLGMSSAEVETIPNGLSAEMFAVDPSSSATPAGRDLKTSLGCLPDSPLIVSISRLSEEKRPLDLPQILKRVQSGVPSASLVHIGAGHLESELKKIANNEGLTFEPRNDSGHGVFKVLGRRSDVLTVLRSAEVFILTSSHEGMPNAVMEAMYAGLPVVATRVGGVPDLVQEGVTGFLHEPGDVSGMAESLQRLLTDADLRKKMGEAGRSRLLSLYTVERLADCLSHAYNAQIQRFMGSAGDARERFAFGENWADFIRLRLTEQRKRSSRERLLKSLKLKSLEGLTFLDIGCGSGLHSLAAFESGAKAVISFDYDPFSVQTTRYLRESAGSPENWTVLQGSVLDAEFMRTLPKVDIVYSWGVLHHTGNVWKAIENASLPLNEKGTFFIALYSYLCYENASLHGSPSPEKWLTIKREYNRSSPRKKHWMEWTYVLTSGFAHPLWNLPAVARSLFLAFREARKYHKSRGMDYWTDVRDWLGGWPMEFVKEQECLRFCSDRLSLECLQMNTGEGNTEFIFRRKGVKNYWDTAAPTRKVFSLKGPFESAGGFGWRACFPAGIAAEGRSAEVSLTENDQRLSFSNAPEDTIERLGAGRYAIHSDRVLFSSLDNSNPNANGRRYAMVVTSPCEVSLSDPLKTVPR